ncbi:MAG TPA: GAF domain-containing sensor histidine kinase [Ideonella sp.]|nr:GAF domain-containing sensor histidine kinase [Ideonella sp.]
MTDSDEAIARDIAAIARISAVPSLLRVICEQTGLGFAAVARVTEGTWTACAVQDDIQFGLRAGDRLDVNSTLCIESRAARQPIVIDHASQDAVYCQHPTPRLYKIESYISVPIVRRNGDYFGNLCAIDPKPAKVSEARTVTMFTLFAELISLQLESEERHEAAESALRDERATAELREQFIAVLGHDLRNPLAYVGAAAGLLARRHTDPELLTMAQRLRATTSRMSRLIDDVLDFARSRLGAGIGLSLAPAADLATALSDVVGELRGAHPERAITEHIAIAGPVRCDRGRVQQLLSNLLANALTHGAPDQPVRVEAAIAGAMLTITVNNHGEPIAAANLGRVFEPYWRPASSQPGGGLGLGLYICAQIVKAHGGTLQVCSSAEAGTCFTACLPVDAAA